ncbi:MAG: phospho-N-acetylmuramoyl-pentapeptide-transferase [Firmicutes bacterium]|nr:phospho-N-acetylmuramoyl-pentapeptide-transferase [Bacillota bacterium]
MDRWIIIIAAVVAYAVTALMGFVLIPALKRLKYGQTILDIGPNWHKSKEGTPTMGGLMMIAGALVALAAAVIIIFTVGRTDSALRLEMSGGRLARLLAGMGLALFMSLIGFVDDYIKVVKKRNLGLTAKQKTFAQLLIAAAYLFTLYMGGMHTTELPFVGTVDITHGFGLVFWPIALMFIYGFTNAVNLTDGIDGLATTVTAVVAAFFMFSSIRLLNYSADLFAVILAGVCIGFAMWNLHPAKVFMGDTGSMFLGGCVVGLSFMIDRPILLILAGIVYLCEAMSVVIQVAYFKRTGRRIFKMSPIHHHFELSGWSENKIVLVFSLVAALGCAVAVLLI